MTKQKSMNNKGFSLVELIIVIAIMAVLVGVLAPAYLSYVEKSKKNTDVTNIGSVMNAMKTVAMDPDHSFATGASMKAVFTTGNKVAITADATVKSALETIIDSECKLKSTKWTAGTSGNITITGTVDANGNITFTCDDALFKGYAKDLKFTS